MVTDKKGALEIDLKRLMFACLHKWWLIVLCAVTFSVAAGVFTAKMVTPMYQSKVMFYVNNATGYEQVSYISSSNLAASQQLVNTYISIVKTDTVMQKVAEQVGDGITASIVRSALSASRVTDTVLFNVVITHHSPETALRIAQAVADVVPDELTVTVEGSSTKVVDQPKLPRVPSSPSIERISVLGGIVGVLLAITVIALQCLLDVRIKDEGDLDAIFDIPVLGQIPSFSAAAEKSDGKRVAAQRRKKRLAKKGE